MRGQARQLAQLLRTAPDRPSGPVTPAASGGKGPVQRRENAWRGQAGEPTPNTLFEEIRTQLGIPEPAMGPLWAKPPLSEIRRHQASNGLRPTEAAADLTKTQSDARAQNPPEVSVHAMIGNLEATLRASGASAVETPVDEVSTPVETPDRPVKPSESSGSGESAVAREWGKKMGARNRRKEAAREEGSGMYQAGHLVAYQFMGPQANVFINVAPQGAQLNNVAFQNWEHDVLAATVCQVREALGRSMPEDSIPHFFHYRVKANYAGDAYSVSPEVLVAHKLIPADWQTQEGANASVTSVGLTKRIPVSWEAVASPLPVPDLPQESPDRLAHVAANEAAGLAVADAGSYGIVDPSGALTSPRHFEASGPKSRIGGQRASRGLKSMRREGGAPGFSCVLKALAVEENDAEEALGLLMGLTLTQSELLAAVVLAMPGAQDGNRIRKEYGDNADASYPKLVNDVWIDRVTGSAFRPDDILGLAERFSKEAQWKEEPEILGLRGELNRIGGEAEREKTAHKVTAAKKIADLKQRCDDLKEERQRIYEETKDKASAAYLEAEAAFKAATTLREAAEKLARTDQLAEFERITLEERRDKEAPQRELTRLVALSERSVLQRYLSDALLLEGALALIHDSDERRRIRATSGEAPVRDPRQIDFLDPQRTLGLNLARQPLAFAAQETQP
ncbi:hypothetical protein CDL60_04195 [Roseateles noduli]|nr:hypothetical protein CDL60_04195 [Roseateles noduli]